MAQMMEMNQAPAAPGGSRADIAQKKKRRRLIRRIIIVLVILAAVIAGIVYLVKKGGGSEKQAGTAEVMYGSISSMVEGTGLGRAKKSESLTLATAGTVMDVFVAEGDMVEQGDPLFTINSPGATLEVQKAQEKVDGIQKELNTLQKNITGLNLTAPYAGKLLSTKTLVAGDEFSPGVVATLADDTKMRLEQYYSYAYAGVLKAGQSVTVSVPALMTTVQGTVEAVHMVSRVTPEGARLFSADIIVPNEGVLAKDMAATASATVNGEEIYPYESGKLDYTRSTELSINVSGTVLYSGLVDYLSVSAGETLVRIDGESSEAALFSKQQELEDAKKALETARKNLALCEAVAPISGKVIGLNITPGQELEANYALVSISDTATILITTSVDERNISKLKVGMSVNLDQWGTSGVGTVETVSLSSTVQNGVATYPVTIIADNAEGALQVNSYLNYTIQGEASENCLVVPVPAVRTVGLEDGSSATVVYVKADSAPEGALELPYAGEEIPEGFYPVPVEIGLQDTSNVEIKSGLNEGDVVFTQMITDEAWG